MFQLIDSGLLCWIVSSSSSSHHHGVLRMELLRVPLGKHFGIVGEEWIEHEVSLDLSNSDSPCMQTLLLQCYGFLCFYFISFVSMSSRKQPSKDVSLCPCHPHGVLSENPHPPSLLRTARNARQTNVFFETQSRHPAGGNVVFSRLCTYAPINVTRRKYVHMSFLLLRLSLFLLRFHSSVFFAF